MTQLSPLSRGLIGAIEMNSFSFLGAEKVVLLNNQNVFTAEDMYSEWKEWVITDDNAKYEKAFDTTGGDDVGSNQEIAPYFFLRNNSGWRIKMPAQNGELVMSGNLFPRDASQSMFIQAEGYDAFLRLEVSTRAVVIRVPVGGDGVGVLTTAQSEQLSSIKTSTDEIAEITTQLTTINGVVDDVLVDTGGILTAQTDLVEFDFTGLSTFDPATTAVITDEASRLASKADVSNLPTDAGLTDEQAAKLDEIAAIKASTDLIPALL